MQLRSARHARYLDQVRVVLVPVRRRPLLELDDHIRRSAGVGVRPGEDYVGALRGERQVVFDQHLYVAEPCIGEIAGEHRQASTPRLLFGWAGPSARAEQHLFQQLLSQRIGMSDAGDVVRRRSKQGQGEVPQAARNESCGWGHVRGCESQRKSVGPLG